MAHRLSLAWAALRCAAMLVSSVIIVMNAAPATAQITTDWINTTGSPFPNFDSAGNWTSGVPNSMDTANFNQAANYDVFLGLFPTSDTVNVTDGDVRFFTGITGSALYLIQSNLLIDRGDLTLDDNVTVIAFNNLSVLKDSRLTVKNGAAARGNNSVTVGGTFDLEGTHTNNTDFELLDGGLLTAPLTSTVPDPDSPGPFNNHDLELTGTGRVYVSGMGNTATIGMPNESTVRLLHNGDHTLEAINGATLVLDRVRVEQSFGNAAIHAGASSTIIMRGTPTSGSSVISGGRVTTTGDGRIEVERGVFALGTIELSSAGQLVVPAGKRVIFNQTQLIVDSESQLDFDPTAEVTATQVKLQINGDHTFASGSTSNDDRPISRLFGNEPTLEPFQAITVTGTSTFPSFSGLHLVGGTFTTGSINQISFSPALTLATGTFNLTASDLELGTGMPIGVELQGGTTDINVTNGDVNLLANGVFSTNGSLTAEELDNAGQIGTIGGSMAFSGPATNQPTGQINAINVTLNFNGGLTNNGELNLINTTVNGAVNSPAGASVEIAGFATFNGDVTGGADFNGGGSAVINAGYAPGNSPAAVQFGGDLSFGSLATLEIELGGLSPGTDHDQVNVAGTAMLGGTLDVLLTDGFMPAPGDTFEIITAANILGTFATETLPTLPGSLEWFVNYSSTSVELISTFAGDFDGDVDGRDFLLIQRNDPSLIPQWEAEFGTGVEPLTPARAVPEPATWVMILAAIIWPSLSQRRVMS